LGQHYSSGYPDRRRGHNSREFSKRLGRLGCRDGCEQLAGLSQRVVEGDNARISSLVHPEAQIKKALCIGGKHFLFEKLLAQARGLVVKEGLFERVATNNREGRLAEGQR